jgi:hypothetical protein
MSTIRILVARSAPVAVFLEHRRAQNSHWSRAILWRTDSDRLEPGSWLKAKLYAEKASISPNGKLLGFFAARFDFTPKDYSGGYIAVSRPPYLTPLSLWDIGSVRGGATWFPSDDQMFLQCPWQGEFAPHPDFASPPDWLRVDQFPGDWDSAEESGWRKMSEGSYVQALDTFGARTLLASWEATGSSWWEGRYSYFLRREGKPVDLEADQVAPLNDGRLAIVRGDEVFIQDVKGIERLLLTTRDDRPRPRKPPAWATTWDGAEQDRNPAR